MQAVPSLSAALMMLCRATAVSPWQVCKSGSHSRLRSESKRNAKNKTEGEKTGRVVSVVKPISTHKIQLPELPQSWIQYSIENFPSTPGHQHKWDIDVGPAPEPHSLTLSQKSSGDFMRYLGEMFGQERVWSSFPTWPVRLEYALCTLVRSGRIEMAPRSFPVWNATTSGAERGKYEGEYFTAWIGDQCQTI